MDAIFPAKSRSQAEDAEVATRRYLLTILQDADDIEQMLLYPNEFTVERVLKRLALLKDRAGNAVSTVYGGSYRVVP